MSSDDGDFVFRCPECEEELTVNGAMRSALIDKGCVICGAAVSSADFVAEQAVDS